MPRDTYRDDRERQLRKTGEGVSWDDLRVPLTGTQGAGVRDPDFTQVLDDGAGSTGVYAMAFASNQIEELFFQAQMPHSWLRSSDIDVHVHWIPAAAAPVATEGVRWGLEYTIQDIGGTFAETSTLESSHIFTTEARYDHIYQDLGEIDMSGITGVSAMILGRVYRDPTHGDDDWGEDAHLLEIDFHFKVDSLGSDEETSKTY